MSDLVKTLRPWLGNIITIISSIILITWSIAMENKQLAVLSEKVITIEKNMEEMKVIQKQKDDQQDKTNILFQERVYHQLDRVENKVDTIAMRMSPVGRI